MPKKKIRTNPYLTEDPMLDEIREIRRRMSKGGINVTDINRQAQTTMKTYGLKLKKAKRP